MNHLLEKIESYAKQLQQVDFWSGKVKNSATLAPAYEAQHDLQNSLKSHGLDNEQSWQLIESYAKDLELVDNWSGKVLSSSLLDKAYASRNKIENLISVQKKIKP